MTDALDLTCRNRHDALEVVKIRTGIGRKTIHGAVRVSTDARLMEMLEDLMLEAAFHQICAAYMSIAGGQMAQSMDYSAVRGGTGAGDGGAAHSMAQYFGWAKCVQQAYLDHAMCMDVIAFGNSLRTVDRNRRQTRGKAKENLIECLKLWA